MKLSPRCRQVGEWKGFSYCGACRYFKGRQDGTDWKVMNRDKDRLNHRRWMTNRRKDDKWWAKCEDGKRHIRRAIKTSLWPKSMIKLIGCSFEEFKNHISYRFVGDMSWDNHGIVWSVDHRLPIDYFEVDSEESIRACFNIDNLQPMYVHANMWKKCDSEY